MFEYVLGIPPLLNFLCLILGICFAGVFCLEMLLSSIIFSQVDSPIDKYWTSCVTILSWDISVLLYPRLLLVR